MIDKHFGDYVLICDICGEESGDYWDRFEDAVQSGENLGWKAERHSKGWTDICPDCQEAE